VENHGWRSAVARLNRREAPLVDALASPSTRT